ncbi:hypothetical protein [Candidatus Amarobacter glycogenicus]|uniref:hypothetical protein n=1 Tax=Candidatus Amarobacter glycogenicus TaxID=3140699 RepID=UPI003134CA5C|nr:hypothetical protein [Dehalococcoidia bacterium]
MVETPYASEDVLQSLIERYPNLLAGDQVNPDAPAAGFSSGASNRFRTSSTETSDGRWITSLTGTATDARRGEAKY